MVAVASIITVAFLGSVLITPLYSLYQHKFGFSEITLTLIYAVYENQQRHRERPAPRRRGRPAAS